MKEFLWVPSSYAQDSDCPFKAGKCTAYHCLAWICRDDESDIGRCILLPAVDA